MHNTDVPPLYAHNVHSPTMQTLKSITQTNSAPLPTSLLLSLNQASCLGVQPPVRLAHLVLLQPGCLAAHTRMLLGAMDVLLAIAIFLECTPWIQSVLRVVDALPQLGLEDAIGVVLGLHLACNLHRVAEALLDRALGVREGAPEVLTLQQGTRGK